MERKFSRKLDARDVISYDKHQVQLENKEEKSVSKIDFANRIMDKQQRKGIKINSARANLEDNLIYSLNRYTDKI